MMVLFLLLTPLVGIADQKGLGDDTGIARSGERPPLTVVDGVVKEIDKGICEKTTGCGQYGAHAIVTTDDARTLNIHLGPVGELGQVLDRLQPNTKVKMKVFRTTRMKADQFVAKEIQVNGETQTLRDDSLRPVWAGRARMGRGRNGLGR